MQYYRHLIQTHYVPATDTEGAHIHAIAYDGRSRRGTVTLPMRYDVDATAMHYRAARRLADSLRWSTPVPAIAVDLDDAYLFPIARTQWHSPQSAP